MAQISIHASLLPPKLERNAREKGQIMKVSQKKSNESYLVQNFYKKMTSYVSRISFPKKRYHFQKISLCKKNEIK